MIGKHILDLPPTLQNKRNSEGAFLALRYKVGRRQLTLSCVAICVAVGENCVTGHKKYLENLAFSRYFWYECS